MRLLVTLLSICLLNAGCTSFRTIPIEPAPGTVNPALLAPGRTAQITLRNGQTHQIRITAVDANGVAGTEEGATTRYAFADMQQVQVRRFSWGRTLGVVGATLVVLAGAFVYTLVQAAKNSD